MERSYYRPASGKWIHQFVLWNSEICYRLGFEAVQISDAKIRHLWQYIKCTSAARHQTITSCFCCVGPRRFFLTPVIKINHAVFLSVWEEGVFDFTCCCYDHMTHSLFFSVWNASIFWKLLNNCISLCHSLTDKCSSNVLPLQFFSFSCLLLLGLIHLHFSNQMNIP